MFYLAIDYFLLVDIIFFLLPNEVIAFEQICVNGSPIAAL